MGCHVSKAVKVQPMIHSREGMNTVHKIKRTRSSRVLSKNDQESSRTSDIDEKVNEILERKNQPKQKQRRQDLNGSLESLGSEIYDDNVDDDTEDLSERWGSATSKSSKESSDSGMGDDYAFVITENSHPNQVEQIMKEFDGERDIELGITGIQCTRKKSAKMRARQEEQDILQALREEGLITRHTTKSSGGVSFEVVAVNSDEVNILKRAPPRLAKLERNKKEKKASLTAEEIHTKLAKAERRRKEKERAKIAKLHEMDTNFDQLASLESFAQHQVVKEFKQMQKMDTVTDNREKRLKQMQERLKAQKDHAEEVRQRKSLALRDIIDTGGFENRGYKSDDEDAF